jgi:glycosyltransferase involved in cell wall biosynthesis
MKSHFNSARVSVIIPNHNYAAYVSAAIESVLEQTYRNFEIIVVNNGSVDNSLEILKGYGRKIILIDQPNMGQSGARNAGLAKSTGELLAFLDADDLWESTKLERQIALLREDTQLIYSGLARFDSGSGRNLSLHFPIYKGDCTPLFVEMPGTAVVLGGESTALFSRELWNKVGEFDSKLSISAGWDFFRRCASFTNFDFTPEVLARYRIHGSNMSSSPKDYFRDMRHAYYKLTKDAMVQFSLKKLLLGFAKLEWSFVKTLVINRSVIDLSSELIKIPYFSITLIRNYMRRV